MVPLGFPYSQLFLKEEGEAAAEHFSTTLAMTDRTLLCLNERYADTSKSHNEAGFAKISKELPRVVRLRRGPRCISRHNAEDDTFTVIGFQDRYQY